MSLAQAALVGYGNGPMCRPCVTVKHPVDSSVRPFFQVKALRNATQIRLSGAGAFVPNDIDLGTHKAPFMLLTGPNTGGKSTLMRQVRTPVALVLCAAVCDWGHVWHAVTILLDVHTSRRPYICDGWHAGVPCNAASTSWRLASCRRGSDVACRRNLCKDGRQGPHHDGAVHVPRGALGDRCHALNCDGVRPHDLTDKRRVHDLTCLLYASTDVWMLNIARWCLPCRRSLVALDELGRGTATLDGTAIASAVLQDVVQRIGCRGIFATHYHVMADQWADHSGVAVNHMACDVENSADSVVPKVMLCPCACFIEPVQHWHDRAPYLHTLGHVDFKIKWLAALGCIAQHVPASLSACLVLLLACTTNVHQYST